MRRTPIRILHVDLAQELADIPGDPRSTETWIVFWWHSIPLGRLELPESGHPLPVDAIRRMAAPVIAPAVAAWYFPEVFIPEQLRPAGMTVLPHLGLGPASAEPLRGLDSKAIPSDPEASSSISVVVCTRNRPDDLARCLQSLQQLRPRPLEILVVDNAPERPGTRELVAGMSGVSYVAEPRPGLSRARNAGVRAARGTIVAFTDDDVRVTPNWIGAMEHIFQDPGISVLTGLVLPAELEAQSQLIFELGTGGFGQGYMRRLFDTRFFRRRRRYGAEVWRIGAGASMALRRSLFERVGLFDERLGAGAAGCSEDSEFWYRVLAAGGACCYDPRVVVYHYHRREIVGLKRQAYLYLRGHVAALLIQFEQHRHWGNLRRLVLDVPWYQSRMMVKGILRQTKHRKHLLTSEIRGTVAGVLYYLRHGGKPAYLTATGESPPPALVASLDLDRPLPDIPIDRGYRELWLLARQGGTPVGWLARPVIPGAPVVPAREYQASIPLGWLIAPAAPATGADSTPPVSIVICTRDRPELLQRCLESARCIRYPAWELIVVDNASRSGASAEIAARFGARYVREDRPGLDWARNRGIAEASHDIIAFTDDDVRIDAGWLAGLARAFADPTVMAVTGMVAPLELATPAQMLFERVYGGMGKGTRSRRYSGDQLGPADLVHAQAMGVGANMAYRRTVFDQIGGFDTALDVGTPAGGAGDLDMFHRVVAAGLVLHYEPGAMVWHQHRREMSELRRQFYHDGRSFAVYLRKLWRTGTVSRPALAGYVAGRWVPWLLGRTLAGLVGRHGLPFRLLLAELRGALSGPGAYRAAYRSDERIRRQMTDTTTPSGST